MEHKCVICEKEVKGFVYKLNGEDYFRGECNHLTRYTLPKKKTGPAIIYKTKGFHCTDYGS